MQSIKYNFNFLSLINYDNHYIQFILAPNQQLMHNLQFYSTPRISLRLV